MTDDAQHLEDLLTFMCDARGFDFTGYKRSSLTRRIRKRMAEIHVATFADYRDVLEADAQEFRLLFDTVLINVTSFFRDSECWEILQADVIPDLVGADGGEPLRVWVAGCSTGEEAYSLAISFAEVMGPERFRQRVKIYATDVDEDALRTARHGVYPAKALVAMGDELKDRYFDPSGTSFAFRPDLRRQVIFGRHDITRDAPISRLHLLSCRNTLMYFNATTQADILDRFHFALVDKGYLLLGRAEMLLADGNRFEQVSMPHRLFRRRPGDRLTPRSPVLAEVATMTTVKPALLRTRQLRDLAIDTSPAAHVIVDVDGVVTLINNQARAIFGLTSRDQNRPLRDLEISYRPVELRSLIEQAQAERRSVRLNAVERTLGINDIQYLDLLIQPLVAGDGVVLGVDVVFTDTTSFVTLQEEAKRASQDLETAYEELQSTNEELETTNEELQSTVEELETTNEELQSTNEELETTNEELQSTNEELETMNEELRTRTSELDEARRYLEGVLRSVPAGVVVLDAGLQVQMWNAGSEELWGLREDEVRGQAFFGLDIGLPTAELRGAVRRAMAEAATETLELTAVNRRGRTLSCNVEVCPLGQDGEGLVMLMEARQPGGEQMER